MDCDDVTLLLAAEQAPTLAGAEAAKFHQHITDCEVCRELAAEPSEDRFRWIARIPDDALDDPEGLVRCHASNSLLLIYGQISEKDLLTMPKLSISIMRENERAAAAEVLRKMVREEKFDGI